MCSAIGSAPEETQGERQANMINYDFPDRVALVTGGASGIGLATARAAGR